MDTFIGCVALLAFFGVLISLVMYFVLLFKHNKPKRKVARNWLIGSAVVLVICGFVAPNSDDNSSAKTVKKATGSQNLPNQKINEAKATKHEFYWTSKSDKKVRYFVDDDKKITAIKIVLIPDVNNTWWCEQYMEKVLHDDHLKFSNDKKSSDDIVLNNDSKYNVYSPKHKKWYWVRFDAADNVGKKDNMVASFAIYPGKNEGAQ